MFDFDKVIQSGDFSFAKPVKCPVCGSVKFTLLKSIARQTIQEYFWEFTLSCEKCGYLLNFSKPINRTQFLKLANSQFANFSGKIFIRTKEDGLKVEKKSLKKRGK